MEDEREVILILNDRRLDTNAALRLETNLCRSLDGVTKLVIDMAAVVYVSSSSLRVLLAAQHAMGDKEGSITLRNVCDDVLHILEITGFTEIFTVERKKEAR